MAYMDPCVHQRWSIESSAGIGSTMMENDCNVIGVEFAVDVMGSMEIVHNNPFSSTSLICWLHLSTFSEIKIYQYGCNSLASNGYACDNEKFVLKYHIPSKTPRNATVTGHTINAMCKTIAERWTIKLNRQLTEPPRQILAPRLLRQYRTSKGIFFQLRQDC